MNLQFFGASETVTGSCYLLNLGKIKVLVECGLFQGDGDFEPLNTKPFPFDPKSIDAVLLTHAHLDHSGRLPFLVKQGFRGKIITHKASKELSRVLLTDAAMLQARFAPDQSEVSGNALFNIGNVKQTLEQMFVCDYREKVDVLPGVKAVFYDAGHILGSAIVEVHINVPGLTRKIVFSGDLGHKDAPILQPVSTLKDANLVLMESTYGDRCHRAWKATWKEFGSIIKDVKSEGGNIIIPSFTIGRTQELLYIFQKFYEDWDLHQWKIFVDSPMAIEATNIYMRFPELLSNNAKKLHDHGHLFNLPNMHFTSSVEESKAINSVKKGAIIIAGSGMCNGGRVQHHLAHRITDPTAHIVFVGFQVQGTKGRQLVDGAKKIELFDEQYNVKAKVHTIGGFSAHADQKGLLDWYGHFNTNPPLILTHGESQTRECLARKIYDKYTVHPMLPKYGDTLDLNKLSLQN